MSGTIIEDTRVLKATSGKADGRKVGRDTTGWSGRKGGTNHGAGNTNHGAEERRAIRELSVFEPSPLFLVR